MNLTVLIGRLIQDPELRFLPGNGTAAATFTLAVDKGLSKDKKTEFQKNDKPTADFIRIKTWGKQAENCANYLAKGKKVSVQGSIETGSYEKDGRKVYTTDINAQKVTFLDSISNNPQHTNTENENVEPIDDSDIPF